MNMFVSKDLMNMILFEIIYSIKRLNDLNEHSVTLFNWIVSRNTVNSRSDFAIYSFDANLGFIHMILSIFHILISSDHLIMHATYNLLFGESSE